MKKELKRLALSKKTISNLNVTDMEKHAGGGPTNGKGHTCTKCVTQHVDCSYTCIWCTYSCGQGGCA